MEEVMAEVTVTLLAAQLAQLGLQLQNQVKEIASQFYVYRSSEAKLFDRKIVIIFLPII